MRHQHQHSPAVEPGAHIERVTVSMPSSEPLLSREQRVAAKVTGGAGVVIVVLAAIGFIVMDSDAMTLEHVVRLVTALCGLVMAATSWWRRRRPGGR